MTVGLRAWSADASSARIQTSRNTRTRRPRSEHRLSRIVKKAEWQGKDDSSTDGYRQGQVIKVGNGARTPRPREFNPAGTRGRGGRAPSIGGPGALRRRNGKARRISAGMDTERAR